MSSTMTCDTHTSLTACMTKSLNPDSLRQWKLDLLAVLIYQTVLVKGQVVVGVLATLYIALAASLSAGRLPILKIAPKSLGTFGIAMNLDIVTGLYLGE